MPDWTRNKAPPSEERNSPMEDPALSETLREIHKEIDWWRTFALELKGSLRATLPPDEAEREINRALKNANEA